MKTFFLPSRTVPVLNSISALVGMLMKSMNGFGFAETVGTEQLC